MTPEESIALIDNIQKVYGSVELFLKEIIDAATKGAKIRLIKAHRCATYACLKESKDIIESWVSNQEFTRLQDSEKTEEMLRKTIDRQSAELSVMREEKWGFEEQVGRARAEVSLAEDGIRSLKEDLAFFKKRADLVKHYEEVLKDLLSEKK